MKAPHHTKSSTFMPPRPFFSLLVPAPPTSSTPLRPATPSPQMLPSSPRWPMLWMLLLGLLLATTATSAWAFPIRFGKDQQIRIDIATTTIFEYHTRNFPTDRAAHAPQYMDLRNKLDLNIQYNEYIIGGRVDTFNFFLDRTSCPSENRSCKSAYLPEKLFVKYRKGHFDVVLGDYYLTLGRGVALSIRKVDEFGLDTTLRGARATYDNGSFQMTVGGGFVNNSNYDPIQEVILADTNDFIFGGRAVQRFGNTFSLGGHYVYFRPAPLADPVTDDKSTTPINFTHVAGGSLQFDRIGKKVDIYFEGNAMVRKLFEDETLGYALYTNFTGYFFPVTVRLEASWNRNYIVAGTPVSLYQQKTQQDPPEIPTTPILYINPPSMDSPTLDNYGETSDVRGFRARLDYTYPSRKAIIYINYMFRAGFPPAEGVPSLLIHHAFAGVEIREDKYSINSSIGWRELVNFPDWQTFHIDFDISFTFQPKQSMEAAAKYQYHHKDKYTYHIFDFQLGYAFAKIFTVAFLLSYSNEIKDAPVIQGWNKNFFVGGQAKMELFGYGSIKVAYGRTRGGLRCVSGVCRNFPAFEGFHTELLLRF